MLYGGHGYCEKGQLIPAPEWWKHLRWTKRTFTKQLGGS